MGRPERSEAQVSTEICRDCGAVYQVSMRLVTAREHDWYHCAVCGRLMGEWDSTRPPRYQFLRPGVEYPPRKPR